MEHPNNPPTVEQIEATVKDFDQAWGRLWEVMFRHFTKVETAGLFSPEAVDTGDEVFALMEAVLHYRDKDVQGALEDGYALGEVRWLEDPKPEAPKPEEVLPVDCSATVFMEVEVLVYREDMPADMYEKDGDMYVLNDKGRGWFLREACDVVECNPMYDFVIRNVGIWNEDGDFEVHPF